eukprot:3126067-Pleurochrysis_carterae.AAC.1
MKEVCERPNETRTMYERERLWRYARASAFVTLPPPPPNIASSPVPSSSLICFCSPPPQLVPACSSFISRFSTTPSQVPQQFLSFAIPPPPLPPPPPPPPPPP